MSKFSKKVLVSLFFILSIESLKLFFLDWSKNNNIFKSTNESKSLFFDFWPLKSNSFFRNLNVGILKKILEIDESVFNRQTFDQFFFVHKIDYVNFNINRDQI
ncbi:hypothetical protein BpHYR1_003609 [Brachionus plicatilis]|uniref:Uncharacterized protein n=1 Tax=Brachionus plicatilis TaxID=10195 RepID=A0A3M7PFM5_BRAPC|nr:hypothetical protein BpHYR1_003609 [Brachionus plicatilis]